MAAMLWRRLSSSSKLAMMTPSIRLDCDTRSSTLAADPFWS